MSSHGLKEEDVLLGRYLVSTVSIDTSAVLTAHEPHGLRLHSLLFISFQNSSFIHKLVRQETGATGAVMQGCYEISADLATSSDAGDTCS